MVWVNKLYGIGTKENGGRITGPPPLEVFVID
jgi:hypothetical protein